LDTPPTRAVLSPHRGNESNNVEADLKTAIKIAQAQTAKGLELPHDLKEAKALLVELAS
jgi:hypothetical protein